MPRPRVKRPMTPSFSMTCLAASVYEMETSAVCAEVRARVRARVRGRVRVRVRVRVRPARWS